MARTLLAALVALLVSHASAKADEPAAEKPPAVSLAKGRFVRISLRGIDRTLALAEVEVLETGSGKNLAKGATASQSSTAEEGEAGLAIDGNREGDFASGRSVTHSATEQDPWWSVDLGEIKDIGEIRIHNRGDCCGGRLSGAVVEIRDAHDVPVWTSSIATAADGNVYALRIPQKPLAKGRYIRVTLEGMDHVLSLSEVQIRETGSGKELQKTGKASQSSTDHEGEAQRAADGNTNQDFYAGSTSHSSFEQNPSWEVDLEDIKDIGQIKVFNRGDSCGSRLRGAIVEILDVNYNAVWKGTITEAYDGSVHEFSAP
ncbi:MAG: discoidin domain-containing protein [Planctomycetes bacterium]|nr:discoidin domain-containing protein [Planctomycetota bacterium]